MRILVTRPLPTDIRPFLPGFEVTLSDRKLSDDELVEALQNYDGLLSLYSDKLPRPILEKATRCKVISNYAAGLDNIDVEAAKEMGIAVCNCPDAVTESTADFTMAIFMTLIRRIPEGIVVQRENKWSGWDANMLLGEELFGKTFGILGYGKIGKAVEKRALGFGMKVVHSRVADEAFMASVDYLSLHCPYKEETHHLIRKETIALLKKKPFLINMARGPIVNTDDLVEALQSGALRGAALDVTDPEPLDGKHPLCNMPNCLVTPHLGTSTIEARMKANQAAADGLLRNLR
ncbi:MAG: Hydroxypyruvate reductase [Chlamydiia bacterium]|nr:Hydroxypyruvate reductase [Chlamydiia bacterium]MCH9615678.1 Hydroxypyruvate reductase [Chlamydiia bacterium]MCH9628919.1 Hydroxypyruvate reductase [Chlamydiia bacterium]